MPLRARLALFIACLLWAISFIATKVALQSAPPLTVVMLRLVISACCFAAWLAVSRPALKLGRRHLLTLVGLSLLGTSLHFSIQTMGISYTTAANASLYAVTAPITILVLAAILLGERLNLLKVLGIVLGICGVMVVMGPQTLLSLELRGHLLGDLLVLTSIVMWGLFTVFGKKITDEVGALQVTAAVTLIGAVWMLPVGLLELHRRSASLLAISWQGWLAISFLGVACSFLATLLYFVALQLSESQKVGIYLYTIPPMTAIAAYLVLDETMSPGFFAGAAMVFAGVALTERG